MTPERRHKIEALYRAALDPEKRAAVLARADPELRSEVEGRLAQETAPTDATLRQETATLFEAGAQVGPYRLEARIGVGGMGEVFRAMDTRLGRTVAIKFLLRGQTADPALKRRFLKEARAASALNHPNIVVLHDIASHEGIEFLVMEHVPGTTLRRSSQRTACRSTVSCG